MKLVYLYPNRLKKVQTCSLVIVQNGRRAKSSHAKTDSIPSLKQQKTFSFSQNVQGMGGFQSLANDTGT